MDDPAKRLTLGLARGMWVTGALVQAGVIGVRVWASTAGGPAAIPGLLVGLGQAVVTLLVIALCFYLRGQAYKAGWVKDAITADGYQEAHATMCLMVTGVTLVSGLSMKMGWMADVGLVGNGLFMLFFVVTWPDGRPMMARGGV